MAFKDYTDAQRLAIYDALHNGKVYIVAAEGLLNFSLTMSFDTDRDYIVPSEIMDERGNVNCSKCVDCDRCVDCIECMSCDSCAYCESCVDCFQCFDCSETVHTETSTRCHRSQNCLGCCDCVACEDCKNASSAYYKSNLSY